MQTVDCPACGHRIPIAITIRTEKDRQSHDDPVPPSAEGEIPAVVRRYLSERTKMQPGAKVPCRVLLNDVRAWLKSDIDPYATLSDQAIGRQLKALGIRRANSNGKTYYQHVSLIDDGH